MSIVEDVLDFLKFLFFLGIVIVISTGIVTPILYDDTTNKLALEDKTSPVLKGEDVVTNYDGTLSPLEVVLMTQVQDFDMPNPKKYRVTAPDASNQFVEADIGELGASYKSSYNLNKYGTEVYALLKADVNNVSKYRVRYFDNSTSDKADDRYVLEVK